MSIIAGRPDKSLELLEFPRLRSILIELTASWPGRERMERLRPFPSPAEAVETLHLVGALRARTEAGEGLSNLDVGNLAPVFRRLEREGAVLEPEAFLALGDLLRVTVRARGTLEGAREDHPDLWALAAPLKPLPHLERSLERTFDSVGGIRDGASPELRTIRQERERLRERLRTRLERLASKVGSGDADSVVTLREGRYVISVPASRKGDVKGLVQDRSGSGATFYIEPFDLVDENNALREKDAEEREEIHRILAELTRAFARERTALEEAWDRIGYLDALRARVRLAERWNGEPPELTKEMELRFTGARHPLLLEARGVAGDPAAAREAVIPLDLELDASSRVLLVTGPNMGGKTVALKCVGLLSVMAQCGCFVPADAGARFPWIREWVVDVGDEQSLEQDLSTFGAHVKRWGEALAKAGPETLVLLDELGSGTDPTEGAALAQSVLERVVEAGGLAIVTTHLGSLKGFAAATEGMQNASMIFDAGTREPTFRLAVGVPGESHALDMARRLGFPPQVVDRAEGLLPRAERDVKRLLGDLQKERAALAERNRETETRLREARKAEAEARERLERFLAERADLRARAARQAREIIRRAEEQAREVQRADRRERVEQSRVQRKAAREMARLAKFETVRRERSEGDVPATVRAGERYWAEGLGREVEIARAADDSGRVLVRHGTLNVELPLSSLRTIRGGVEAAVGGGAAADPAPRRTGGTRLPDSEAVATEVDLRGMRAEEAIGKLDLALDRALLAGLKELRVIHGIGTGALRLAVADYCRKHAAVQEFRLGESYEGGDGATVVVLEG